MIGPIIRIGWCLVCKTMRRLAEINYSWRTIRRAHCGTCLRCQNELDEETQREY